MGAFKKKERRVTGPMFNSSFSKKRTSCKFNCSSIRIGCCSNFWILGAQQGIWKQPLFGAKKKMMMTTTPTLISNKTMKVKRPREGGFCVIFFGFCFVVGPFFSLYISIKPKTFFFTKNLVITYKLSTMKGFYHKMTNCHSLGVF